jgi:hypothetical protein
MSGPDVPWYLQEHNVRSYESWYEGKGKRADLLEKELLKQLVEKLGDTKTLLEVGVGTAHFTRWFESLGINSVGLDFSQLMLEEARKLWGGSLIRGDAHHLPFRDKTFDAVALITCVEYMSRPINVLKEGHRVAREGMLWGIMNKWSLPTIRRRLQVRLGKNPFCRNALFYSILDAKGFLDKALEGTAYRIKWSTTVYPSIFPIRHSRIPFGAFLGVAVKFDATRR